MPGIYFSRISNDKSGFTNQLFAMITSIIIANSKEFEHVVLDTFQMDFEDSSQRLNCSKLFNLNKMNEYLKRYNITLHCKNHFNYTLNSVLYGAGDNFMDITSDVPSIALPKSYNYICGDPCPGVIKELIVSYTINQIQYTNRYPEYHSGDIWLRGHPKYHYDFGWITEYNTEMFEDILRNISYQDKIHDVLYKPVYSNEDMNVIHLRLEQDAIRHWSTQNNTTENKFKELLEQKYIDLIKTHIHPSYKTIVVGDKQNSVVDFLDKNGYHYIYFDLKLPGRELNALYDLIQSFQGNQTFIGNFNFRNYNGSSFSYYISIVSKYKKLVMIDIDNIHEKEGIYVI